MKLLSICIPTYEMNGLGSNFLRHSFEILKKQSFKDFEVIISDHSNDDQVKNLCDQYLNVLDIKYYRNPDERGNSSANLNNSIKNASGTLIKILFQDDFLFDNNSLQATVDNFDLEKDSWMVSACEHSKDGETFYRPFYPKYNHKIHLGKNTISSPSVLTIKNSSPLLFDENLIWLMDCDYYRRYYDTFGEPKILNKTTVANRVGKHQISNTLATSTVKIEEKKYIAKKFGTQPGSVNLVNVTLCAVSSVKIKETINALRKSMRGIKYAQVLFFTHEKINLDDLGIKVIDIEKLDYSGYSKFVAYELGQYIKTDFALIVQNDGYVLRPQKWNSDFLKYDYIGAPWLPNKHFTDEGVNVRVGNGGFSLRSKKLLNILNKLGIPFTDNNTGFDHEDGIICVYYRKKLQDAGIKFAPVEVAVKFSHESDCAESVYQPFGFHGSKLVLPRIFWPIKKLLRILKIRI